MTRSRLISTSDVEEEEATVVEDVEEDEATVVEEDPVDTVVLEDTVVEELEEEEEEEEEDEVSMTETDKFKKAEDQGKEDGIDHVERITRSARRDISE